MYNFYKGFEDHSEPVYKTLKVPKEGWAPIPDEYRSLVDFCLLKRLSRPEISSQFDLHIDTAKKLRGLCTCGNTSGCGENNEFRSANSFVNRVVLERKLIIVNQHWFTTTILNRYGVNQTGFTSQ